VKTLQILSTWIRTADSRVNILRKKAAYIKIKPMKKHYLCNLKYRGLRQGWKVLFCQISNEFTFQLNCSALLNKPKVYQPNVNHKV
jgi:hypothetical protein